MSEAQRPNCKAMILCDLVHRDPGTGKVYLLGTFERLTGKTEPIAASFFAYCAMTEFVGSTSVSVKIVDSAAHLTDDETWEIKTPEMQVVSSDPNRLMEIAIHIRVKFPKAGLYLCQILADGHEIENRRIFVELR